LSSIGAHIAFTETLRTVYRHGLVEAVLLTCVTIQVLSGGWLVLWRWNQRKGKVAWLQAGSGACLAFFLLVHRSTHPPSKPRLLYLPEFSSAS
jgi:hypothetical protein